MIKTTLEFHQNHSEEIYFNPESPFIEIVKIIPSYPINKLRELEIYINLKSIDFNGKSIIKEYQLGFDFNIITGEVSTPDSIFEINKNTKKVLVSFTIKNKDNLPLFENEIYFKLEYQLIDRIKSENQHNLFKNHLEQSNNLKIMFSAPFGHGKSTFLEYFFKDETEIYDIIKLTPINYSVASNDDIFKYIKSDILTQLMGFDLDYETNKTSHFNSLFQFSKDNLERILIPFLLTVPQIGKSLYSVTKDILKLKDDFFDFHDSNNESEYNKVSKFIEALYEKEGSIYEDNFFSQLIRQLLEILKLKTNKLSILIIDDLDRMDPEHIFRILNILSVHFDSFSSREIEIHNKFGFDKIILVCDYENIRKIYEHKYGKDVDFGGYINKYYSKKVFHFNYTSEVNSLLINIDNAHNFEGDLYLAFQHLSSALFDSKLLSLRDLLKIKNIGLKKTQERLLNSKINNENWFNYGLYSPTIAILCDVLGTSVFKTKVENLNTYFISTNILSLNYSCNQLLASYKVNTTGTGIINKIELENHTIKYITNLYEGELININDKTSVYFNENGVPVNTKTFFNQKLFLTLILKNIEEYDRIKLFI